jgi:uncharacterized RDD family membrane protein YckC
MCVTATSDMPEVPAPSVLSKDLNLDRRAPRATPLAVPKPVAPAGRRVTLVGDASPRRVATPVPIEAAPPPTTNRFAVMEVGDEDILPDSGPHRSPIGDVRAEPASLWRRLCAFTVDLAALSAVLGLYLLIATAIAGVKVPETQLTGIDRVMQRLQAMEGVLIPAAILGVILAVAYAAAFAFLWEGRTLGRRLLGIRLVDASGLAPAPARAVTRAVLSIFSFALLMGGFWLALFDRKGQTLHDKLTSTFVIRPIA